MATLLPFSNEIASVLTSSGISIFSGLYQHSPSNLASSISKTVIDFIALSGIVYSSVLTAGESGSTTGILSGSMALFVAFVIPNLTFHFLTDKFCEKVACNPGKKLVFGLFLILVLFIVERYVVHPIAHSFSIHAEESHDE